MLQDYLLPESVADAITILKSGNGQARIIAGGTDLLPDMAEGKKIAGSLVDITRIPELKKITLEDGVIKVGAAVTHNQLAKSELINERAYALALAARSVGSLQIRNSGTVAGNVVNAQPAADTAVALAALGAVAEIAYPGGVDFVPVENMYAGIGESTVDSTAQLVTGVKFPACSKNQGSSFVRLSQRRAMALPMLNAAVMVSLEEDRFEWVRIAMAPVGPGPVRATGAEELLKGAVAGPEAINKAAWEAAAQAHPRDSALRGSREYRLAVLPVLVRRALEMAVARAKR